MKARAAVFVFLAWSWAFAGGPAVPYWSVFQREAGDQAPELAAQAWAESGWNPRAVSYVMRDGKRVPCAYGLMQFIPPTWSRYAPAGADPFNPEASIRAGSRYMADLHRLLGDWEAALGGYNAGPGNIQRARRRAELLGIPGRGAWKRTLPQVTGEHARETLAYVPRTVAKAAEIRRGLL